jgi:GTPase
MAERGFLVGVEMKSLPQQDPLTATYGPLSTEDSLEELAALADTAGIDVQGGTYQRLSSIRAATYIGAGKIEELKFFRDDLDIDVFIFDDELSPAQQRELEKALDRKVIDRTVLILDVFAQHAHTREGQLQVELAQYEYRLPRLTRMWTHLARQAGGRAGGASGGVGVRGPGETQLETDRRRIGQSIARLRGEIEEVRMQRAQHRRKRYRAQIPTAAIVGYTNAGKSTLLNTISHADVLVADQLFATLDPTTRRVPLPDGREILFTDTVGFIQKLPTHLIAAFRATLEEIAEADLILHIVDITHPNVLQHVQVVEDILRQIGATEAPVVTALNKIDRLQDPTQAEYKLAGFRDSVAISAKTGQGVDALLRRVEEVLDRALVSVRVTVPYDQGQLLAQLHHLGQIDYEEHTPTGTIWKGRVPPSLAAAVEPFEI